MAYDADALFKDVKRFRYVGIYQTSAGKIAATCLKDLLVPSQQYKLPPFTSQKMRRLAQTILLMEGN